MRAETPFGQREFFLKSSRPSFLIKRAALGNLKASFHCTHWHRFFPLKKAFSKTYPSFLTLKEDSTFLTKPLFPQGREDVAGSAIAPPGLWTASGACARKGLAESAYAIKLRLLDA